MDSLFDRPEHLSSNNAPTSNTSSSSSSSKGFTFFQKNPGTQLITQRRKLSDQAKYPAAMTATAHPFFGSSIPSLDGFADHHHSVIDLNQMANEEEDDKKSFFSPAKSIFQESATLNPRYSSASKPLKVDPYIQPIRSTFGYESSYYSTSGSEDEGTGMRQHSSSLSNSFQKLQISPTPPDTLITIPIPIKHVKTRINITPYELHDSPGFFDPNAPINNLTTQAAQQQQKQSNLLLGDLCPLKALKKQFPIIFPVGIPIMGELSRFLNIDQSQQDEISYTQEHHQMIDELNNPQLQYSLDAESWDIDKLRTGPIPLSSSERRARVEKYWEKKKARRWKNVRYNVRKSLADQRERISGRFVKQKNSRFNQENLDASYLRHLTLESDRMQLIDVSNVADNSFDMLNNSFES